jgi:hypothetical protein
MALLFLTPIDFEKREKKRMVCRAIGKERNSSGRYSFRLFFSFFLLPTERGQRGGLFRQRVKEVDSKER